MRSIRTSLKRRLTVCFCGSSTGIHEIRVSSYVFSKRRNISKHLQNATSFQDGPVMELNESDFDFHTALDVTFVKFYAPWCGFCQRLAPTWEELAVEDFSELQQEVKIAKIDCTKYSSVCQQYKVSHEN